MAETQYMLALALTRKYWQSLHKEPNIFDDIQHRCRAALALRRHFPEANHLRGNVYYQRARLQEREVTKQYSNPDLQFEPYYFLYERSVACFRKALRGYDQSFKTRQVRPNLYPSLQNEQQRLARLRITVLHQLGDLLNL